MLTDWRRWVCAACVAAMAGFGCGGGADEDVGPPAPEDPQQSADQLRQEMLQIHQEMMRGPQQPPQPPPPPQ